MQIYSHPVMFVFHYELPLDAALVIARAFFKRHLREAKKIRSRAGSDFTISCARGYWPWQGLP